MGFKLGLEAKLYLNGGTYGSPTWGEVTNVKDLTLNLDKGEADVTTRGNNGWKATVATLKDASIEFDMVWDTTDTHFTAIKNAWLNNTTLEFMALDGDVTIAGHQGLRATMMVTKFSRKESLEEALMVSVSVKPTYAANAPSWHTTTIPAPL